MCGIVGILGKSDVVDRILGGLSRLEYRGYDSAGIATMGADATVTVSRAVGKLDALRGELERNPIHGGVGIGHTRWATHGAATLNNAHPHRAGRVTLVHNGIIENHAEIRRELTAAGVTFQSDTDTEVAACYFEYLLSAANDVEAAFDALLARIVGSYALCIVIEGHADLMLVARNGSPLAVGYGEVATDGTAEMFVGSDALALAPFTDRVCYLEDGDRAIIRPDRVRIFDGTGSEVTREIKVISAATWNADKGPYRHFMLKEIHDQPDSLSRLLATLIDQNAGDLRPFLPAMDFSKVDRVVMIACGTAHYACHVAKYWFEKHAGLPVEIDIASEYRYRPRVHTPGELVIVVSQSGETADTLAALKDVRGAVPFRLAVVNVATSSIAREADDILDIQAGPEIGVASTKAFTGQMLALLAMALRAGKDRGRIDAAEMALRVRELAAIPRAVLETLAVEPEVQGLAEGFIGAESAIFLGRGINFPIALEAALKLKEISYIHAEGYAAGELKHGPIALIDESVPVVVFDSPGRLQEKTASNAAEVSARGARVRHVGPKAEDGLVIPDQPEMIMPFAMAVVAQMIAYYVALAKGTDVDQPRNLAKSVTVE